MGTHAFLSPSGAPAWLRCFAKVWREKGLPNSPSDASDHGTAAHYLQHQCLRLGWPARDFLGRTIVVGSDGEADWFSPDVEYRAKFDVDYEMVNAIQMSLDWIQNWADVQLYSEVELNISGITCEVGATGTADVVQIWDTQLCVTDLKFGKGVQVFAMDNEQLMIYAYSALQELDLVGDITDIHLRIAQPRMEHFDVWIITRTELESRVAQIRATAMTILSNVDLPAVPGDKQCKFCKAKATCTEYRDHVLGAVTFDQVPDLKAGEVQLRPEEVERVLAQAYGVKVKDVNFGGSSAIIYKPSILPQVDDALTRITTESDLQLATIMDAADMIEGLVKAVRAEVERRLLAGSFTDSRYKLVEGKKGARSWIDEADAEKVMKSMRLKLDQMYDMNVKSPTQIEKVIKESNPRKWAKLQDQITQNGGKPSVAPASDKRPALNMKVEFEPVTDAKLGLSVEDELI